MIEVRQSHERGQANHGWLKSQHSFSFASYYDPNHMGVSVLRVINDDQVQEGQGFSTHSHQDMEIISYVKRGTIEHKDSMGHIERLPAGEFQVMSAGTGVTHSEYNPSDSEPLEFLQIWIQPNVTGAQPSYQQKKFPTQKGLQLIASLDEREDSLLIRQDASLYQLRLDKGLTSSIELVEGRTLYIHVVSGVVSIDGYDLKAGDGASITSVEQITFKGQEESGALVFDLP